MKQEFENLLKIEMEYTEQKRSCRECAHYNEKENPHLDRDWIQYCSFNSIGSIVISPEGTCKFWEERKRK